MGGVAPIGAIAAIGLRRGRQCILRLAVLADRRIDTVPVLYAYAEEQEQARINENGDEQEKKHGEICGRMLHACDINLAGIGEGQLGWDQGLAAG